MISNVNKFIKLSQELLAVDTLFFWMLLLIYYHFEDQKLKSSSPSSLVYFRNA